MVRLLSFDGVGLPGPTGVGPRTTAVGVGLSQGNGSFPAAAKEKMPPMIATRTALRHPTTAPEPFTLLVSPVVSAGPIDMQYRCRATLLLTKRSRCAVSRATPTQTPDQSPPRARRGAHRPAGLAG